ncbi:hypothetical protein NOVOSPHI9U_260134 [Novosphingobium sp. 9U]|nr:hypothetical protein NOVOSPHI9U_260134 [Novosphingobium sp. 9U]
MVPWLPDGTRPEAGRLGDLHVPSMRPGSRLAHAWLEGEGRTCSTLYLVTLKHFTLFVSEIADGWHAAIACSQGDRHSRQLRVRRRARGVSQRRRALGCALRPRTRRRVAGSPRPACRMALGTGAA